MKTFKTLRGFLDGTESDDAPYFAYSATLRVIGEHLDFDQITSNLDLDPSNIHRKGDRKAPGSREYPSDLWSYTAPIPEERPLSDHIDALWQSVRLVFPRFCSARVKYEIY